jgi:hypothetical protein
MMIEIKNASFTKGKEMMKALRAEKTKELRKLERQSFNTGKMGLLRKSILMYSVSKTLPVKCEGLIFNGKLLQTFIKKLRSHDYEVFVENNRLIVTYSRGRNQGRLELEDISYYFQGFPYLPELVIKDD